MRAYARRGEQLELLHVQVLPLLLEHGRGDPPHLRVAHTAKVQLALSLSAAAALALSAQDGALGAKLATRLLLHAELCGCGLAPELRLESYPKRVVASGMHLVLGGLAPSIRRCQPRPDGHLTRLLELEGVGRPAELPKQLLL
jgi:hypothetical protein